MAGTPSASSIGGVLSGTPSSRPRCEDVAALGEYEGLVRDGHPCHGAGDYLSGMPQPVDRGCV
jgi:hypothetical protein